MGLDVGTGNIGEVVLDPANGGYTGRCSGLAVGAARIHILAGKGGGGGKGGEREELPGLWAFFGAAQTGNVV